MKIRLVGTELLNEHRRTYIHDEAKSPFSQLYEIARQTEAQNRLLLSFLLPDSPRYEPGNVVM
jgi:hypothetical protein